MEFLLGLKEKYKCDIVVAVAGQPNVGKSTLFNILTGEHSHVANWPGVTVGTQIGQLEYKGKRICFVDLPGVYGLSATSLEEIIAREYIVSSEPDVILVLVDSTAPERTAYLALQVLELNPRVVIALTKSDLAHPMGIHIHVDKIESLLGVPVISVSAIQGYGIRELLDRILEVAEGEVGRKEPLKLNYGSLEGAIREVEQIIESAGGSDKYPLRWLAIRLLEGDEKLEMFVAEKLGKDVLERIRNVRESVRRMLGRNPAEYMATVRFAYIDSLAKQVIVRTEKPKETAWDRFAELIQKPIIGPLIGFGFLFTIFVITFSVNTGFPLNIILRALGAERLAEIVEEYSLSGLLEIVFSKLSSFAEHLLAGRAPEWFVSLVVNGIIPGVGAVLSFFPLILIVSLFLAALEDSGLAPRLAAGFHNFFAKFGLSGRAIYPMLISLGCNVPSVIASRSSIEDEERYEIIFASPFVPCQARLVVLLAFASAYFASPLGQAAAIMLVYGLGIAFFLLTSLAFRLLYFRKREPPEFLLEMPPIHKPNAKVVWWITWDWSKHFLKKAGVIIFALSVLSWGMLYYGPKGLAGTPENSFAAIVGRALAVLFAPFGIPEENAWKIGYALFFGLIAKEGLIEAIVLLQGGKLDVSSALLALGLTQAQAVALLVFMMLYVPCLATIAIVYQESKSAKITLMQLGYMFLVAYIASLATYGILSVL